MSLLRRLGLDDDTRALIITCVGLGTMHAANVAVAEALRSGLATDATLHVPGPWARGAVSIWDERPIGVGLTLNAEFDHVRWGPITVAPTLLDGDGGFPRTVTDLWEHADTDDVRRECRAQLERAIGWGVDVTHLDGHLLALHGRPEMFDVLLDLAVEFALPISMPADDTDLGFPARAIAADEGVVMADNTVRWRPGVESREAIIEALTDLPAGVTEVQVRPAADTLEHRAMTPTWPAGVGDAHLVTHDWGFRAALHRSGAVTTGFGALRSVQRADG